MEDKKHIISELIDTIKPIEVDISRNEDMISGFRDKIEDQAEKIAQLSQDLLDHNKRIEALTIDNSKLQEKNVEGKTRL